MKKKRFLLVALAEIYLFLCSARAYAYYAENNYSEPASEGRNFLFQLITGGFGTFVILFMGLGGLASVYITRQGNSMKRVPILGIIMLCLAMITFIYRVLINAGVMGHEYIDWSGR